MSMITATTWVPRGFAAQFPSRYKFDEEEYNRISKLAQLNLEHAKEDLEEARNGNAVARDHGGSGTNEAQDGLDDDLKEYDLEHYDDDGEDDNKEGMPMGMFSNIKSLAYYETNEEDPYITIKENEEDDDEREELEISATDNLLLAAKIEDEVAHLEVYVYEDEADNLYVHHDIMLPAMPLAVEWLDFAVGKESVNSDKRGNFVAVGTMDPDIEIWDLDTVDCMFPNAILGQGAEETSNPDKPKKKKKKKSKKVNDEYHVDAVLSLAANRQHRNLLASASADNTIKLWDLNSTKCAKSYTHHTDKVCSVTWHPQESTILLSGGYDRTVVAADMRAPDSKPPAWAVDSDVESVRWDPHDPSGFYVATESGILYRHDARTAPSTPAAAKPVWTLQAHNKALSAFDVNPIIPGLLATGSSDKEVKLWNVQNSQPTMIVSRDLHVGKVFSTKFAPDETVGFRLAVAGSRGKVQIWDTSTNAAVRNAFAGKVRPTDNEVKERLVGVQEDSSESDDADEGQMEAGDAEDQNGGESMEE